MLQVNNLEDELIRCTDIKSIQELTKSKSISNFKSDFRKLKDEECKHLLKRHKIDISRLWSTNAPECFDFANRNSFLIKIE